MSRPYGDYPSIVRTVHVPGPDGPTRVDVIRTREHPGGPLREVFVAGARGDRATINAVCRLLSLALQNDEPIEDLIRMLRAQTDGNAPVPWPTGGFTTSLPDALARLLEEEQQATTQQGAT